MHPSRESIYTIKKNKKRSEREREERRSTSIYNIKKKKRSKKGGQGQSSGAQNKVRGIFGEWTRGSAQLKWDRRVYIYDRI